VRGEGRSTRDASNMRVIDLTSHTAVTPPHPPLPGQDSSALGKMEYCLTMISPLCMEAGPILEVVSCEDIKISRQLSVNGGLLTGQDPHVSWTYLSGLCRYFRRQMGPWPYVLAYRISCMASDFENTPHRAGSHGGDGVQSYSGCARFESRDICYSD
jgi:hypothetical protein